VLDLAPLNWRQTLEQQEAQQALDQGRKRFVPPASIRLVAFHLAAARRGEQAAFERLVARHRRELLAHGYRMLGSVQDAEDALQESLLAAWRGLAGFEGRSSLRSWLYQVTTHACLRLIDRRPRRDGRVGGSSSRSIMSMQ
jgi:DNA-directed RNA polymerase specialized sigma24 family protein